ncbi:hypothetical protein [Flavobacterium sp. GP15]|uniref:hypothetical protein n=1 Tax=Flavobacterium sp. GP15 TaxID=2758567 RepID=UPI00165DF45E|nr:hypothetical protein [Flavobacterium sp. GP15]
MEGKKELQKIEKAKAIMDSGVEELYSTRSLDTLTLMEVGKRLNLIDIEAIKRWLNKNKIRIYKFPKQNYVYQIDLDCEIDKIRVTDLRKEFPDNWEEVYKKIAKDNAVYEMVVISLGGQVFEKIKSKITVKNKKEEDLFNRYSA